MKYKPLSLVGLIQLIDNFLNKVHLEILNLKKLIFLEENKIFFNKQIPKNFKKQIHK